MKKRIFNLASIIVFLLVILTISGCGSSSKESKIMQLYVSGDKAEGSAYSKMVKKYEKETGQKIQVVDVPYADLTTKITKMVQAGDPPALARISGVDPSWKSSLMDLSSIASKYSFQKNMLMKDENGKVLAVPTDLTAVGMFINKDLFEKAGIKIPTSENDLWTWNEFIKSLNTILDKTDAKYGMVMDASDHRLRAFTYQFGSKDFYLNKSGKSYTTNSETKVALDKFVSLNDNKIMPKSVWTTGEDPSAMFKSGRVAAYMSGVWQITDFSSNIKSFKWQSVLMPYEKVRATNLGGNFLVGFKNSKLNKEAKKFITWLYKKDNYAELCKIAGYLPAVTDISVDYSSNKDAYEVYEEEIKNSSSIDSLQTQTQVENQMKGKKGITGEYRKSMVKVLNGEMTVDEAIKATIADYNQGFKDE